MKKNFKGTPGLWENYYNTVYSKDGDEIASVYDGKDTSILEMDREMSEANARLIAAAPELLEALQKTNELIGPLTNEHIGNKKYRDFVIQYADNIKIINKALGNETI